MTEQRKQSPHYIPELDPASPKRHKNPWHWVWLTSLAGGFLSLIVAGAAYYNGLDGVAGVFAVVGLLLLSPILLAAFVGG